MAVGLNIVGMLVFAKGRLRQCPNTGRFLGTVPVTRVVLERNDVAPPALIPLRSSLCVRRNRVDGEGICWQIMQAKQIRIKERSGVDFGFPLACVVSEIEQEALESDTPQIQVVKIINKIIKKTYVELSNENFLLSHSINCFYPFFLHVNIKGQILPYVSTEVSG